jgi:hypothetical protein
MFKYANFILYYENQEGGFFMSIKIELDDKRARKKLEDVERNLKKVKGKQTVPFSEIFNPAFMYEYTEYSSFYEMLDKSELLEKYGDFESIDDEEWDMFIQKNTNFSNWEEMKSEAGKIWMIKQIGL